MELFNRSFVRSLSSYWGSIAWWGSRQRGWGKIRHELQNAGAERVWYVADAFRAGAYKPCTFPVRSEKNGWKEGLKERGLELLKEAKAKSDSLESESKVRRCGPAGTNFKVKRVTKYLENK